jgi:hypothetical protein
MLIIDRKESISPEYIIGGNRGNKSGPKKAIKKIKTFLEKRIEYPEILKRWK